MGDRKASTIAKVVRAAIANPNPTSQILHQLNLTIIHIADGLSSYFTWF